MDMRPLESAQGEARSLSGDSGSDRKVSCDQPDKTQEELEIMDMLRFGGNKIRGKRDKERFLIAPLVANLFTYHQLISKAL